MSVMLGPGVTMLLGVNGAGKTTLMRTLVGDLPLRAGQIIWRSASDDRHRSAGRSLGASTRRRTGYLPQSPQLPGRMRLADVVAYAAWLKLVPRGDVPAAVERALRRVDLLPRKHDKICSLSGGMRQRAALATAIVHDPDLLVLDEPTSGLDPRQRVEIRDQIAALARGTNVLMSTHIFQDVAPLGGHLVVLHDGSVVFDGLPADLEAQAGPAQPDGCSDLERGFLALIGRGETGPAPTP
ncbi:MAG: ABC transporter ATP-binding protein [Angustibacter sp.]